MTEDRHPREIAKDIHASTPERFDAWAIVEQNGDLWKSGGLPSLIRSRGQAEHVERAFRPVGVDAREVVRVRGTVERIGEG